MDLTIWHNPRCSKSRATLALLSERGRQPTVREYLADAPTVEELRTACDALGLSPRAIVRTGEAPYTDLGLAEADDERLLAAMAEHPILIQRPIVFAGERAAIGRPPEDVLDLL